MTEAIKLCINCTKHIPNPVFSSEQKEHIEFGFCKETETINAVSGRTEYEQCWKFRMDDKYADPPRCGKDARFFEPKEQ